MILRNLIIPAIITGAAHAGLFFIPPDNTPPPPPSPQEKLPEFTFTKIEDPPVHQDTEKEKTDLDELIANIKPMPTVYDLPRIDLPVDPSAITMPPQPNVDPKSIKGGEFQISKGDFVRGGPKNSTGGDFAIDFVNLDNKPKTLFQASPDYPYTMKVSGASGEVLVRFTVDEQGYVHDVRVIRSSHREFEEPTVRAVSKWRFEPGKKNGRRVKFQMSVPVSFSLNDAE